MTKKEKQIEGIIFKGRFCPYWGGGVNIGRSQRFFGGGLCNISVTLLVKSNDASIVEVYEEDTQTERSNWNKREETNRNR